MEQSRHMQQYNGQECKQVQAGVPAFARPRRRMNISRVHATYLVNLQELYGQFSSDHCLHGVRNNLGSELADRHEAVVGTVLHKKPTAVGAVHRNVDCKVLLLQLSHALPEDGGLVRGKGQDDLPVVVLVLHDEEFALHAHAQHLERRLKARERALGQRHETGVLLANLDIGTVLVNLVNRANNLIGKLELNVGGIEQLLNLIEQVGILLIAEFVIVHHLIKVAILLLFTEHHP
mmetsp:Transcript_309/g.799  ORF Transcript_309/g.799 Transcript_309/m.799 type:complete len:234 (+) Transcript_309:792-1493(+)